MKKQSKPASKSSPATAKVAAAKKKTILAILAKLNVTGAAKTASQKKLQKENPTVLDEMLAQLNKPKPKKVVKVEPPKAPTPKAKAAPVPPPAPKPAPVVVPEAGFALPATVPPPPAISLVIAPDAGDGKKARKRYVSKTDPTSKYHLRDRSEAEKPVSIVRRLCVSMKGNTRKEVITACIKAGVNINTAATQYSLWKSAEAKAALAVAAGEDEGEE